MFEISLSKVFLVVVITYHLGQFGEASFSKVSSAASQTIEKALPASVASLISGHGRAALRQKRDVVSKSLDDPAACVYYCNNNETRAVISVSFAHAARLIGVAMKYITEDASTPQKEAALKKKVEADTIANMGPMFEDLCAVSKKGDDCVQKCPKSQLRDISVADRASSEALCEPSKNWPNFTVYWDAMNCTNSTQAEKVCDKKCGPAKNMSGETHLRLEDAGEDEYKLRYENDAKKNTATAATVCKTQTCYYDCYKQPMTKKCGAKAYDMYVRMDKIDTRIALAVLQLVNAVNSNVAECKGI